LYPGRTIVVGGRLQPCTAEIEGRYFYVVTCRCTGCTEERVLLDADFHGWNGYLCHDPEQAAVPRPPLVVWRCRRCNETAHKGSILVAGEGRADMIREMGPDCDADRWPDAFGWFEMDCDCVNCGEANPGLFPFETM